MGRKYLQRTARRTGLKEGRKRLQDAKKVMPSGARGTDPLLGRDIIWAFAKGAGGGGKVVGGPGVGGGGRAQRHRGQGVLSPFRTREPGGWGPTPEALWDPGSQRGLLQLEGSLPQNLELGALAGRGWSRWSWLRTPSPPLTPLQASGFTHLSLFFLITSPQHPFLKRVMSPDHTHTHTHTHTRTSLLPRGMREMITFLT